jgi:hypothetical protein
MSRSNTGLAKLPVDYQEILYWKVGESKGRVALMNLLSIPLALVFGAGFLVLIRMSGEIPNHKRNDAQIWILLIGIPAILAAHELIHGVTMQVFHAKVNYGFYWRGLMFYAKAPGFVFTRNQYLLILLGPLVILTLLACMGMVIAAGTSMVWIFALWGMMNATGTGADLMVTALVLRYPSSAYIVDQYDGIRIFLLSTI